MPYKFKIIFSIALVCVSIKSIAQQDEGIFTKKEVTWEPAYIVMRTSGDTIHGMMSEPRIKTSADWVNFYTDNKSNAKKYKSDSISAFTYMDIQYKYFKYSGWSILIHKGAINIYKGNIYVTMSNPMGATGTSSFTIPADCLVFKKGDQKAKFIGEDEVKAFSRGALKQKTKDYFVDYIADDSVILKEFSKEDFKFKDLEELIVRYNAAKKQ